MLNIHRDEVKPQLLEDVLLDNTSLDMSNNKSHEEEKERNEDNQDNSKLCSRIIRVSPPETKTTSLFATHIDFHGYVPIYRLTKKTFFVVRDKHLRDIDTNMTSSKKNLFKALIEHKSELTSKDPYISLEKLEAAEKEEIDKEPLIISAPMIFSHIGGRKSNEDAEFVAPIKCIYSQGVILGVLDGHGGKRVSNLAKDLFPKIFHQQLVKSKGDVRIAFENS